MAQRWWVGGTNTWDGTIGTKWATTSGGAGGVAVPTAADDVFFDAVSGANTITLSATSVARSINCTGFTGTITHPASTTLVIGDATAGASNIALKLVSSMTYTPSSFTTSLISFQSTSATVQSVDYGGKTTGTVEYNGAGGSWQLIAGHTANATSTVSAFKGTFNTNGQTCSWGFFSTSGVSVRTVTLGASAITLTGSSGTHWNATTTTNLTFNANTSAITVNNTSTLTFAGGGLTYNNVIINHPGTGTSGGISGANTFANFTFNIIAGTNTLTSVPTISSNQIVTGTFTAAGFSTVARLTLLSLTAGVQQTITAATTVLSNVDFIDIAGAGAAAWTGTSIGDGGGNSGITFDAPTTRYAVAAGSWSTAATWSVTSGGASGASVPLPQDNVVLNGNSGVGTITRNMVNGGKDIICTGYTGTLAITQANSNLFGSLTLVAGMTATLSAGPINFRGRGAHTITSAGQSFTGSVTFLGAGSTYTLQDDLSMSASTLTLTNGILDANGKNVTCLAFNSVNTNTRGVVMGAGIWTLTGTAAVIWNISSATGLTFTRGNAIVCNYSGATGTRTISNANSGEASVPSFNITAGTDTISIGGTRINSLDFTGFAGTFVQSALALYGDLVLSTGMTVSASASNLTMVATSGTRTITSNGKTMDFPVILGESGAGTYSLVDNLTLGSTRTLTLTIGTFTANNKNVTAGLFGSSNSNTRTLTMGSGTWTLTGTGSVWNCNTATNLTINPNTSTIAVTDTSASAKSILPGTSPVMTLGNLSVTGGGAGTITINSTVTFNNMTIGAPKTVIFQASQTKTISSNFSALGTAGNVITFQSSSGGTAFILSKTSGIVSCDYLSVQDSTATGGAFWYAGANSTNVSNNSGWLFIAAPALKDTFMPFF